METRCPECEKRLRLPETYTNQKIRCRNCGTIFRPVELATNVQVETSRSSPADEVVPQPVRESPRPSPAPVQRPASRSRGGGGFGIAVVVALMLLTRIPRLFKDGGRRDRNRPVPVEVREENMQVRPAEFREVDEKGEFENELADPEMAKKDQPDEVADPESDKESEFPF